LEWQGEHRHVLADNRDVNGTISAASPRSPGAGINAGTLTFNIMVIEQSVKYGVDFPPSASTALRAVLSASGIAAQTSPAVSLPRICGQAGNRSISHDSPL
jgi:hypothetical protein